MRLLALVADTWAGKGGIAQYDRDLLGGVLKAGVEVRMCCYSADPVGEMPAGMELGYRGRSRAGFVLGALRAAKEVDAVFCGHLHLVVPAWLSARRAGVPLWVQVHGIEAWERPKGLAARAMKRADLVTAVSRYSRGQVLSWLAVPAERVRVLPNTVAERFSPGERSEALVRKLGLEDRKLLLTVGRLAAGEAYKGHDRVIRALPELLSRVGPITYLIVGTGDDQPRLARLATELDVSNSVVFAGEVPAEELPDYYRLADAYVMPSTGEGFGIAFLEALSCGVPAIGLATDGSRDPLSDPRGMALKNPEDLPIAIEAVLTGKRLAGADAAAPRFGRDGFENQVRLLVDALGAQAR